MSPREAIAALQGAHGTCADAPPYCLITRHGKVAEIRGHASAEFGHQIPSAVHTMPDGIFAHWHWDGTRLVVNNDRYGIQPLFWFRLPDGGICISPSLATLVEQGAPVDLDTEALAVFFRLGFFVGDDTPFSAIRTVPPNAVFAWEGGNLECSARYPAVPKATPISRDDAIDAYIELFGQAMSRRRAAPEDCVIPLSGGRDSRHILLELHRTGFKPALCVSAMDHPPDPNEDPRIAAALCKELGFPYVTVDQQLSPFCAQVRKNRETHFCASAHGWYLALADFLNGRCQYTYDGIAGDVLSQSKFLSPELDAAFHSRDLDAICSALISRQGLHYSGIRKVLKGELRQCLDPAVANGRLAREVPRHLDNPNPVASFIFWNRTRREIALAPYGLLRDIPFVYAPFLDHDLFDFLSTLPSGMLLDHRFHDDTIARAYPGFAGIPYARNAAPLASDTTIHQRFMQQAARKFLLKRPSRLMKNLAPRAKMLASIACFGHFSPWVTPLIIYLDQLESLLQTRQQRTNRGFARASNSSTYGNRQDPHQRPGP